MDSNGSSGMKILGVDTSTPIGSVGLIDGGRFVAEHTLSIVKAHSSRLMPAIDQILKWGDLAVHDLDACAVGIGPGSFTGIRIGVGAIKSLCYALKKPIVGISTLEAIAYNLRYTDKLICPILDARKDEVYGALFRGGQNFLRKSDDLCVPIESLLSQIDDDVIFVGDGLRRYEPVVQEQFGKDVPLADPIFNVPRGASIARIGYDRLRNGQSGDYFSLTPNYVRDSVT